jgi:hypothetical protein
VTAEGVMPWTASLPGTYMAVPRLTRRAWLASPQVCVDEALWVWCVGDAESLLDLLHAALLQALPSHWGDCLSYE